MKTINNNDITIQLNIDEEHVINYGLVKSIDFIFYTSDNKTNSIVKDLSHCDLYNYITLSWDELKLLEQGILKYEYTINVDYQTTYKGNVTTDYYICTNITNSNEFNRITLNDFYTKEQIDSMLQDSDLSNYYTKAEVNYLIPTDYIKSIPSEYITESELNAKGYLTEHQDLSKYALKTDIPTDYIKSIPSEYVTETELNNKGYLTQHQSLEGYAKLTDIPTDYIKSIPSEYITESELNSKGYITEQYDDTELSNRISALETELNGVSQQITELNNMVV